MKLVKFRSGKFFDLLLNFKCKKGGQDQGSERAGFFRVLRPGLEPGVPKENPEFFGTFFWLKKYWEII